MPRKRRNYTGAVVVAIANPMVRRALMDAFRQSGADDVIDLSEWKALAEILEVRAINLLVADDTLSDRPTGELIRKIRRGELHAHPFPLIVMLAHQQEEPQLRALIDSGPDAIVVTPVSIADLFAKVDLLAAGRKPFVVTRDYIGPDRRKAPREGTNQPLIIQAPNPLAPGTSPDSFQRALKAGESSLKTAKMECSLGQLAWAMQSGRPSDFLDLIPAIDHLAETATIPAVKAAAAELTAALRKGVLAEIMESCRKLLGAVGHRQSASSSAPAT